jgi:hypothetical protein
MNVEVARCGSHHLAASAMAASMPDVLILDASLSGAELLSVYRDARGREGGDRLPIIFSNHPDRYRADPDGPQLDFYFAPGLGPAGLAVLVAEVLGRVAAAAAPADAAGASPERPGDAGVGAARPDDDASPSSWDGAERRRPDSPLRQLPSPSPAAVDAQGEETDATPSRAA